MWNLEWGNEEFLIVKEVVEYNLVSDIKWDIFKFDIVLFYLDWSSLWWKYLSKILIDINVLSCGLFFLCDICKNFCSMYVCVLDVMV